MNHLLQKLYDSEINFSISTFWDGGFDWKLGDEMNGFREEGGADTFDEAVADLVKAALKHFPDSVFAHQAVA
jgi:hypothetical protein